MEIRHLANILNNPDPKYKSINKHTWLILYTKNKSLNFLNIQTFDLIIVHKYVWSKDYASYRDYTIDFPTKK